MIARLPDQKSGWCEKINRCSLPGLTRWYPIWFTSATPPLHSLFSARFRRYFTSFPNVSWSDLGWTTFQWVIGLYHRLQRQSEDETIGPSVPCKLAFALRVCVPSCNCSRSITDGSGARCSLHLTASTPTHFDRFYCRTLPDVDPPPQPPCAHTRVTLGLLFAVAWSLLKCRCRLCYDGYWPSSHKPLLALVGI